VALGALTRESIERAVAEYDSLGQDAFLEKYGFGRATHYAVVVDGREYDPKAIAGVAYGYDHPEDGPMRNTDFSGGLELRRAYRPAGFDIVLKTRGTGVAIREGLEKFMASYIDARRGGFTAESPVQQSMRDLVRLLREAAPVQARPELKVVGSVGKGNWASVPWIAFLDRRVTETTQEGVYPVFLFREDMSGVYLTVAQGVTNLQPLGRNTMIARLNEAAERVRGHGTSRVEERQFTLDSAIDLRSKAALARAYALSTVAHKLYQATAVPEDSSILGDLDAALELVDADIEASAGGQKVRAVTGAETLNRPQAGLAEIGASFRSAVDAAGLLIPEGTGDRVRALVAAVAAKPFIILTGMSGSGKTQLALRLGDWFGKGSLGPRFLAVPVRPDWTGPEALFGYEDALRPPLNGEAAWFVPRSLRFLLNAAHDPTMPYLLLLDEMNLAHVERYFSDFLSGVESRDAVLPNLVLGKDGEWRRDPDEPALIPLPRNVVVIGTVNVDETTYQFSPKVLDRATTFEVRTSTAELSDGARPSAAEAGEDRLLEDLVQWMVDDSWQERADTSKVTELLHRLHLLLAETDNEFGHRVFYESRRLAVALSDLGVTGPSEILDHIVLLKILPRIHGSRRRAEPVLQRLMSFAIDPDRAETPPPGLPRPMDAALPLSAAKLARMLRSAEMNQFVSFTE
jgi:5-methylcytosine-specific restriction protein B